MAGDLPRAGDDRPVAAFAGPALAADEVGLRASRGVAILTLRGAVVLLLAVGANIALARMLVPADFGLIALGTAFVVFGAQLAHGGVGAGLIRREQDPTRRELQAMNAVQLAASAALAAAAAAVGGAVGRDGLVVATMAASLPIFMLRGPAIVVLERQLRYREISIADMVEAIAFYAWALGAVGLGMGVWGVATGAVVRAAVGTATMARLAPLGLLRPRWSWPLVRPLIGFGVKLQAVSLASVAREQGINVAVTVVAGVATLGVWNLAWRILQVPMLLFATAGRIAYPAVSRLLDAGEPPRAALERGTATLAVAMGVVVTALSGFAPALPVLTGAGWADVPAALLWSSIAIVVGPPIVVVASGYLMASDQLGVLLRSTVVSGAVWAAVTLPLVVEIGAPAVGIGWIAAAVVNAAWLARRVGAATHAKLGRRSAVPALLAIAGIASGWALAHAAGETLVAGVAGAAAGELVLLGGLALFRRRLLAETYALVVGAVVTPLRGRSTRRAA